MELDWKRENYKIWLTWGRVERKQILFQTLPPQSTFAVSLLNIFSILDKGWFLSPLQPLPSPHPNKPSIFPFCRGFMQLNMPLTLRFTPQQASWKMLKPIKTALWDSNYEEFGAVLVFG